MSGVELNAVAVGNVAILRAIDAGGWSTRAELAQSVGKDPRNLPRDIGVLAKAGLIADAGGTALSLTEDGRAQLEAIGRAEGQTSGGDLLPDERLVVHAQLRPDPNNPRKDFQSDDAEEGLDELRQSILLRGRLLQNLVVRADPEGLADYIVTTGNRRWHAIQQAIWDGDWPEDRPIRVVVREGTAQEHLLTAVTENMIRRSMSAIEESEAFGDLLNIHGMKTIDISHETGLSQKVIQNRLKLLRLSDDDKERMRLPEAHPEHLGYKAALRQLTVRKVDIPEDHPELDAMLAGIVSDFGLPFVPEGAEMAARDALRFSATTDDARAKVISACQLSPPPNVDRLKLTPKMILRLVEVAHALDQRPSAFFSSEDFTRPCTDCTSDIYSDAAAMSGTMGQLIEILFDQEADRRGARLSVAGHQVLVSLGLHPAQQSNALFRARCAADINAEAQRPFREEGRYVTRWLNTGIPSAPAIVREPGSPDPSPTPPETSSLGKKLTDTEALILAEIVDKAEREPNDQHPDYTAALPAAMKSGVPHLIARGLLGTRQLGMTLLIRPLLHTSGLKEWLEDIGFNRDRKGILSELAIRVQGIDNVVNREQCGIRYATAWLNLEGDPRNTAPDAEQVSGPSPEGRTLPQTKQNPAASGEAESGSTFEPEQPELIEATEEEKAARKARREEKERAGAAEHWLDKVKVRMAEWCAAERAEGRTDYVNAAIGTWPHSTPETPSWEACAAAAISALATGDHLKAIAVLSLLQNRPGERSAARLFRDMPVELITQIVNEARQPQGGVGAVA